MTRHRPRTRVVRPSRRVEEPPSRRHPSASCTDAGMATAEYAVATLAAVGFAGLLLAVLSSGEVQEMLVELVRRALSSA